MSFITAAEAETTTLPQLTPYYYEDSCPQGVDLIRSLLNEVVTEEPRMAASLLRLHFHDCFVNGCDGSVLLDGPGSEKEALPNRNSARGFEVIENIKGQVETLCPGIISCADILTLSATESVALLGGPTWTVLLGRRDSTFANFSGAGTDLPAPFFSLYQLISAFKVKGLTLADMVALSGAHTIGFARCTSFRSRIYGDKNINMTFAKSLQSICPRPMGEGDDNLTSLDDRVSSAQFDTSYYSKQTQQKGLLHSDQELLNGGLADEVVLQFSSNSTAFFESFVAAMIKMGNLNPLTGERGIIRKKCNIPEAAATEK
ncbi:peroxidase 2-like [Telopea speciosissima]|uniref:peroxidase 2-like n=1 Tax=Telopea speciosissima TaxID=54955 RepID=UPI001CC4FD6C|nr:peroxidase 2-like [Telopea speciosissima]